MRIYNNNNIFIHKKNNFALNIVAILVFRIHIDERGFMSEFRTFHWIECKNFFIRLSISSQKVLENQSHFYRQCSINKY